MLQHSFFVVIAFFVGMAPWCSLLFVHICLQLRTAFTTAQEPTMAVFGYHRCFACGTPSLDHSSAALHYEVASLKAEVLALRTQVALLSRAAWKEQTQEPAVLPDAAAKPRFFLRNEKLTLTTRKPPADVAEEAGLCLLCDDPAEQRCHLRCGEVFCKRCFDIHMEDDCEWRLAGAP